ncbi:MAG: hypothetical protein ACTSUE_15220 [Promethearchaeota archaeon]
MALFSVMVGNRLAPMTIGMLRYYWMVEPNPYNFQPGQAAYLNAKYHKEARSILYRSIPRSMLPELEPILQEILPLLQPIPGMNLTKIFPSKGIDIKLQKQANRSDLTTKDFRALNFYESVRSAHDYRSSRAVRKQLKEYQRYKVPKRTGGYFGEDKQWTLASGRFFHNSLMEEDVPWYIWPLTWFNSSYRIPLHKRFYQQRRVKVTGLFYYPPGGYAEWHTNRYDIIGWRFYYVRTKEPGKSWFRYKHAMNETVHLAPDGEEHYNMFYLEEDADNLVWHSVYSDTDRFSIGLNLPSMFAYLVLARLDNDTTFPLYPDLKQ